MNPRLELLLILILLLAGVILTIRSRWFDRVLNWAFGGKHNQQTTPSPATTPEQPTNNTSNSNSEQK